MPSLQRRIVLCSYSIVLTLACDCEQAPWDHLNATVHGPESSVFLFGLLDRNNPTPQFHFGQQRWTDAVGGNSALS